MLTALSSVQDKGAWGLWSTKELGTYSQDQGLQCAVISCLLNQMTPGSGGTG